jgi:hypothetical protein
MKQPTHVDVTENAELAITLVRQHAPETRLLPMAARPVLGHPEYQQVNRVDRSGAALKGGWTFLVNIETRPVIRTVGDPTHSISTPRWAAPYRSGDELNRTSSQVA